MLDKNYVVEMGTFECIVLKDSDGVYDDPIPPLFGNAPQEQLAQILKKYGGEFEQESEWISPYICLLIKTGSRNVLVDTGIGFLDPPVEGDLLRRLEEETIAPDDIDFVLITHAHGDHCGGNIDAAGKAAFKNARYVMHEAEWDFWTTDSVLAQPQYDWMVPVVDECLKPLRDRFDLVNEDTMIVPGVNFISAPGHTPGHTVVQISSEGEQLWYLADTFLHPAHIERPDWFGEVDIQPEQCVNTRKSLLNTLGEGQSLLQCFHFPYPGLGYIRRNREGYRWHPLTGRDER